MLVVSHQHVGLLLGQIPRHHISISLGTQLVQKAQIGMVGTAQHLPHTLTWEHMFN